MVSPVSKRGPQGAEGVGDARKGFSLPVKSLAKKGLVGGAGVRAGWRVDLRKTLHLNPSLKTAVPAGYDVLNRFLQARIEVKR